MKQLQVHEGRGRHRQHCQVARLQQIGWKSSFCSLLGISFTHGRTNTLCGELNFSSNSLYIQIKPSWQECGLNHGTQGGQSTHCWGSSSGEQRFGSRPDLLQSYPVRKLNLIVFQWRFVAYLASDKYSTLDTNTSKHTRISKTKAQLYTLGSGEYSAHETLEAVLSLASHKTRLYDGQWEKLLKLTEKQVQLLKQAQKIWGNFFYY